MWFSRIMEIDGKNTVFGIYVYVLKAKLFLLKWNSLLERQLSLSIIYYIQEDVYQIWPHTYVALVVLITVGFVPANWFSSHRDLNYQNNVNRFRLI